MSISKKHYQQISNIIKNNYKFIRNCFPKLTNENKEELKSTKE